MSNSRTKNTVINTIYGLSAKFATMLLAFVVRTIFIKVLGLQYAGVQGVFGDILLMLSFAELGIGSAITFALYKPIAENDHDQIAKLMYTYKRIYQIIAGVVLGVGICILPFLGELIHDAPDIKEDLRLLFILYVINSASSYLLVYKTTFLTAAQKDYLVSKYRIIISIAKTVLECIILLVFRDFVMYLCVSIACGVLQNYIIAKVAEREYPVLKENISVGISKPEKKKLFKDVRALFIYKVSGTVLNGTDSVVTSYFLGVTWVGLLGNYYLISNQLYGVIMNLFQSTSASIGNLAVTSDSKNQLLVFDKMHFFCFWIYCFSATGLFVMYNPFITLWLGESFCFSLAVVALIVLEFWIRGMLSPISQFRTSNGLFVQGKYRPLIMAILNILISIILVQKVGIAGILLGTILSRALTQLWFDPWLIYSKVFNKSVWYFYFTYIGYIATTVFSCIVSYLIFCLLKSEAGWVNLLTVSIICVIIPNLFVVLFYGRTAVFKDVIHLLLRIAKRQI